MLDPSSAGRATENGNRIGAITLEGTAVLLIFGGLLVGLAMSVLWVAIQEWIPGRSLARAALCMPIAVALSGFQLVRPEPRLPDPGAGRANGCRPAARICRDRRVRVCRRWRLARPAPATARSPAQPIVGVYVVMILAGLPILILAARIFLEPGFRRPLRPGPSRGRPRAPRHRWGHRCRLDRQDRDSTARSATRAATHGHLCPDGDRRDRRVAPRRPGGRGPGARRVATPTRHVTGSTTPGTGSTRPERPPPGVARR